MRLLFVFNSPIAKRGSFEDLMTALARETLRRGDSCAFVFPGMGVADFELAQLAPVHIIRHPWNGLRAVWEIRRIATAFGADVVNAHFCDTLNFLPLYAWARVRGIRVVCHFHGEILPLDQVQWFKRYLNSLRLVTMPARRVIAVSRANETYLRHLHIVPETQVIYNGIDVDRFGGAAATEPLPASDLVPSGRYVVYLGSLIPRKRVDFLLRAFQKVAARLPDVKLVVAGGGDVEGHRALAAQLGLAERVSFTGLVRDYPMALVKNAQLFVSASMQESFGLVFAEALALGVPVVACRIGGIPEVVEDNFVGLLSQLDDLDGFAANITRLLEDEPRRAAFAARGPAWARARFALDLRVTELLDSLASCPPIAPRRGLPLPPPNAGVHRPL